VTRYTHNGLIEIINNQLTCDVNATRSPQVSIRVHKHYLSQLLIPIALLEHRKRVSVVPVRPDCVCHPRCVIDLTDT
jgi:hypothetical protein